MLTAIWRGEESPSAKIVAVKDELNYHVGDRIRFFGRDHEILDRVVVAIEPLDIPPVTLQTVRDLRPDVIVNAAAYTAVNKAESEPELAELINAKAPG